MKIQQLVLLLFLFHFSFHLTLEETNTENLADLEEEINHIFVQEDGDNFFIKTLEKLPDGETSVEDIDKIVGPNFELYKKLWNTIRIKATGLVILKMDEIMPYFIKANKFTKRIFIDYYEMIRMNLLPETIFLNRQIYDAYFGIPEELFSEIYTRLGSIYKLWGPLKVMIETRKNEDFRQLRDVINRKNPNYHPIKIDVMGNMMMTQVDQVMLSDEPEPPQVFPPHQMFNVSSGELSRSDSELDSDNRVNVNTVEELKLYSFLLDYKNKNKDRRLLDAFKIQGAFVLAVMLWILNPY